MNRILLLHEVALKRGGKATTARLSLADWISECDRCCVLGYILEAMEKATNQDQDRLFEESVWDNVMNRAIEGLLGLNNQLWLWQLSYLLQPYHFPLRDFNAEADNALMSLDPAFDPKETPMWKENAPEEKDEMMERMVEVNEQVSDLTRDARQNMFTADTLSLAHDLAQVGKLYKAVTKSEHAKKTEKLMHLKSQNTIGASIVSDFMANNLAVHSGVLKDQLALIERVGGEQNKFMLQHFCVNSYRVYVVILCKEHDSNCSAFYPPPADCFALQFLQRYPDMPTIVWCDMMKCGRMTANEIDEFGNLLSSALHARYKSSAAIVIAPYLVSERQSGYRGQLRHVSKSHETSWT